MFNFTITIFLLKHNPEYVKKLFNTFHNVFLLFHRKTTKSEGRDGWGVTTNMGEKGEQSLM